MEAGNPVKVTERDYKLQYVDDATGKTHEFEIPIRTFRVKVSALVATEQLPLRGDDDVALERRVDGLASMEDSSISIISADETASKSMNIQFRPITESEIAEAKVRFQKGVERFPGKYEPKRKTNFDRLPEFIDCELFFSNHQEPTWVLIVNLRSSAFDSLFDRTLANQVKSLSVGIDFLNVYTHRYDHYIDRDDWVKWFLRPDPKSGDGYSPEWGHGKLKMFYMTLNSKASDSLFVAQGEYQGPNQDTEKGLSPEATVDDRKPMLDQLRASVDSLAGQVSRTGWLVGIAILVAAYLK